MDKNRMKEWLLNENPKSLSQSHIACIQPELNEFLLSNYPVDLTYGERIYWFLNDLTSHPKCYCGKNTKFRSIRYGYNECCSTKCSNHNPNRVIKISQTKRERYGDASYNNREKSEETFMRRYNVKNPFACPEIQQKIKETYRSKYGVEYPSQASSIQDTRKQNTLKRYGVDHTSKLEEVKNKIRKSNHEVTIEQDPDLIGYDENGLQIRKCPHPQCNLCQEKQYIISTLQKLGREEWSIEPCTHIFPIQHSRSQGSLIEVFVRKILEQYNIEYQTNARDIISPYELDIYIPDRKMAIECNGIFWHSVNNNKDNGYHEKKFNLCKEHDIQLLTIWEDQIKNKPDIVESVILSKLGIYKERIYARKCQIRELNPAETVDFLQKNHIQGKTNSQVRLGLIYNNIITGVMTFSKRSKLSGGKNDDSWELTRFCTIKNIQVLGGADKLLQYFLRHYNAKTIISFSSNDISNGNLYRRLGFEEREHTSAYWYISKKTWQRYHRTSFSKSRLQQLGYDIKDKTEREIMKALPFWTIYDCGHVKYVLNI